MMSIKGVPLLCILCCGTVNGYAIEHDSEVPDFTSITIEALGRKVSNGEMGTYNELVGTIAEKYNSNENSIADSIVVKLNKLKKLKKKNKDKWNEIFHLSESELKKKEIEKFVLNLIEDSRKKIRKKEYEYLIEDSIELSSKKAGIMSYQGVDYLSVVLERHNNPRPTETKKPENDKRLKVSIQIKNDMSKYAEDFNAGHQDFFGLHKLVKNEIHNFHTLLSPFVLDAIEEIESVQWVVGIENVNSILQPDHLLRIQLNTFNYRGYLRPAISGNIDLVQIENKISVVSGVFFYVDKKYERGEYQAAGNLKKLAIKISKNIRKAVEEGIR